MLLQKQKDEQSKNSATGHRIHKSAARCPVIAKSAQPGKHLSIVNTILPRLKFLTTRIKKNNPFIFFNHKIRNYIIIIIIIIVNLVLLFPSLLFIIRTNPTLTRPISHVSNACNLIFS